MGEVDVLILRCLRRKKLFVIQPSCEVGSIDGLGMTCPFARHMYNKMTPTVVSKCWKYGCCYVEASLPWTIECA